MKTREQKQQEIDALNRSASSTNNAVVVSFQGLNVEKDQQLRRQLREAQLQYRVVKNTLAQRAVEGTPLAGLRDHFNGPTAVAYSGLGFGQPRQGAHQVCEGECTVHVQGGCRRGARDYRQGY